MVHITNSINGIRCLVSPKSTLHRQTPLRAIELDTGKSKGERERAIILSDPLILMADDGLVSGETHMEDRGPTVRCPFA
jgi:hypothetical protein